MIRGRRSELAELQALLRQQRRASRSLTTKRVVSREVDGTEILIALDGLCPERGGLGSHAIGQAVALPVASSAPILGSSGVGQVVSVDGGGALVSHQVPRELERGKTQEVTVHGRSLPPGGRAQWQYLLPGPEQAPNPAIAVDAAVQDDATRYRLTVTVAGDAPLLTDAPLAYDLLGSSTPPTVEDVRTPLPHVVSRFYDVIPPRGDPRYLAYWLVDGRLHFGRYTADGLSLGPTGSAAFASGFVAGRALPIRSDGRVADGSLIWVSSSGDLTVTDFVADVDHTYRPDSGEVAGAAYVAGSVYWIEYERGPAAECPIRLRRGRADLEPDTLETVGAWGLPSYAGGGALVDWGDALAVGFSATSATFSARWTLADSNGEALGVVPLNGSGPVDSSGSGGPYQIVAPPDGLGGAIRGQHRWFGGVGGEGGPGWGAWPPFGFAARGDHGAASRVGGTTLAVMSDGAQVS
ncbi:MAG: hypothetical protein AAGD06_27515, partial [Acidobacteriota bacterium]